jgi:hypothetical protein
MAAHMRDALVSLAVRARAPWRAIDSGLIKHTPRFGSIAHYDELLTPLYRPNDRSPAPRSVERPR